VHRALSLLSRSSTQYYKVRRVDPGELTSIERAARFIYLNRLCFNGLYRTNTRGQFNVPYGGAKSGNIPTLEHLKACSKYLKRARLIHADFRKTLALVQKGDFVYLDPPYAVSNRRVFVEYGAKPFAVEDIKILGQHLRKIDKRGAKFVLSYADCSEARKTFAKWSSRRVLTHRNVAGFAGDRKSQYEIYVTNCQSIPNR
jgi:DNA adenine methylase